MTPGKEVMEMKRNPIPTRLMVADLQKFFEILESKKPVADGALAKDGALPLNKSEELFFVIETEMDEKFVGQFESYGLSIEADGKGRVISISIRPLWISLEKGLNRFDLGKVIQTFEHEKMTRRDTMKLLREYPGQSIRIGVGDKVRIILTDSKNVLSK